MGNNFIVRQCCPACKSTNNETLLDIGYNDPNIRQFIKLMYSDFEIEYDYLNNNNYILNECISCGLIYQKEIPNEFLIKKVYNEWIDIKTAYEGAKKKKTNNYIVKARQLINVIHYLDALPCEINILDFGMGLGAWCQLARGFGCTVSGTDISEDRMDHVKASGIQVIKFEDIPNNEFDFINSDQVFEHIDQPLDILMYLSSALKQNGIIRMSVPNGMDIKKRLKIWDLENQIISENGQTPFKLEAENSLNPVSPFEHINCFNHSALVKLAEKARLRPILIPNRFIELYEEKQEIKRLFKAISRKYYHMLVPTKKKNTSTNLFFKKVG